jgi:hypothetical protein
MRLSSRKRDLSVPAQLKLLTRHVGTLLQAFGRAGVKPRATDAVLVIQAHLDPRRVMVGSLHRLLPATSNQLLPVPLSGASTSNVQMHASKA